MKSLPAFLPESLQFRKGSVERIRLHMAETIKAIKDALILKEAKAICTPEMVWVPEHQKRLIWALFRTPVKDGGMLVEKPEEKKQAVANWESLWENGRLAYPSNTARSLAESGVSAKSLKQEVNEGNWK